MPADARPICSPSGPLGIAIETVEHPPVFTVAESRALEAASPARHTKNLFLKDKKGRFFLSRPGGRAPST